MTPRRLFLALVATPVLLNVGGWYVLPVGEARLWVLDVTSIIYSFGLFATAWAVRPASRAVRLIGVIGGLWAIGNAIWLVNELLLDSAPFPSYSDVFFVAALPVMVGVVIAWPGVLRHSGPRSWVTPGLAAGVAFVATFEIIVVQIFSHGINSLEDGLLALYPFGDQIALSLASGALVLAGTRERGRLALFAAGLALFMLADSAFAQHAFLAQWATNGLSIGWALAFLVWGTAAAVPPGWGDKKFATASETAPAVALSAILALAIAHNAFTSDAGGARLASALLMGALLLVVLAQVWRAAQRQQAHADRLATAQLELEREQVLRAATMDASRTGKCVFTQAGDIAFWNPAFAELLATDPAQLRGWAALLRYLADVCRRRAAPMIAAAPGQTTRFWTNADRFIEVRFESLETGEILVVVDDLTAQEQERAIRARFVAEVMNAREREARRIAELLHDDAVQQLTALALRLELVAMRTNDAALSGLAHDANTVTASLRTLLTQLHPAVLESQGVVPAIESAATALREQGIEVVVEPYGSRHAAETEQLLFRLVQEALVNVGKHARASRVVVSIEEHHGVLVCRVADDGVGFDLEILGHAIREGHLGLHLLQERAELGNGRVRFETKPGVGTTLHIELPATVQTAPALELV